MQNIRIAKLYPQAVMPGRKHIEDAGLDIYACQPALISPRSFDIVPTGITMEIPVGYVALIKPKSRNNHLLGAGVVDAGYQGELLVKIFNPTDDALEIKPGDAIGQILLIPIITPSVQEISLDEIHNKKTHRGTSGGIVSQLNPKN